jgi:hypothetical protein
MICRQFILDHGRVHRQQLTPAAPVGLSVLFDRIWVWRLHRAGVPEVHAGKQLGSSRLASGTAPVDRWGIGILPA